MRRTAEDRALYSEATVWGKYLVKTVPPDAACNLYVSAVRGHGKLSARDARLLRFMVRHRWAVGMIDGGLNTIDASSEVRRRLYTMFSILETRPEFHDLFLGKDRARWYVLPILFTGAVGVLKSACGVVLVKAVGR